LNFIVVQCQGIIRSEYKASIHFCNLGSLRLTDVVICLVSVDLFAAFSICLIMVRFVGKDSSESTLDRKATEDD
jgi:hypothetical protein